MISVIITANEITLQTAFRQLVAVTLFALTAIKKKKIEKFHLCYL